VYIKVIVSGLISKKILYQKNMFQNLLELLKCGVYRITKTEKYNSGIIVKERNKNIINSIT